MGGRLAYAPISINKKFPIVLPSSSSFTRLLFKFEHVRLLHAGPQALLAHIHNTYWPIRGRRLATAVVHQCIKCFRTEPKFITPLMALLPRQRVTVQRPFSQCEVDFCGPLLIRNGIRRIIHVKAYMSVFICLVTRAIHLELVSSLSTEAFLAALSRFISRRGPCSQMFSDNGTNFVGAAKILHSNFVKFSQTPAVASFIVEQSMQ